MTGSIENAYMRYRYTIGIMFTGILAVLPVLVLLSSCTKAGTDIPFPDTSGVIGFGVYAGGVYTKGEAVDESEIIGTSSPSVAGRGVGVFTFRQAGTDQGPVRWNPHNLGTPDFMYNQNVAPETPGGDDWTYSPLKYWPSEEYDRLSFFAYAPYDASAKWENLGITSNSSATIMTASIPVQDTRTGMKDVIWACPVLNFSSSQGMVSLKFHHLLSRVSIFIGAGGGSSQEGPKAWIDTSTTVTVNSIVFHSIADSYYLSCSLDGTLTDSLWMKSWNTGSGEQDITLVRDSDFDADSSMINAANYADASYHPLLAMENGRESYLFLAPQAFTAGEQTVSLTYTVKTTDIANPSNSSSGQYTVTKDLATVFPSGLESGRAYRLKFLLNPITVNINGTLSYWNE